MKPFCISVLLFFGCAVLVKAQSPGDRPKPIVQDAAKPKVVVIGQPGNDVRIINGKEPVRAGAKPSTKYTIQTKPPHIAPDPNQPAVGNVKDISPPKPYFTTIELDASHPKVEDFASLAFYEASVVSAEDGTADFIMLPSGQSSPLLGGFGGFGQKAKSTPGVLLHFKTKQNLQYEITIEVKSGTDRLFYLFPDGSDANYQSFAVSAGDQAFPFIIQADKDGYANLLVNSSDKGIWTLKKVTIKRL